ncbi:hypothetical protein KAF25_007367 [Fusarium avenaceum]|uniref:Uncharacterized protein n=1 Tax=Fusarium avenaceum TaxID=40199 RepID=A0A9P7KR25_9HYPO|nr:hypothetical protein KAF25_007367 [Fusarium avenaceum]
MITTMDLDNIRHRSVSQTSLHGTYQTNGRVADTPRLRSPSQPRLPFQSLNETSALLRSPGPLESMLKTTTETGDLGVYSINPPTSKSACHRPPSSRPGHRKVRRNSRPHHNDFKDRPVRDDRKSLPSYRDTTSEIISLYGTPTAPYHRSFSPASEGQRSHSLTTCSSRRFPSFKSSGTFHSQQSNGGLQRPRSPFPYPTRLKRPGVRPSSPAMTDNGYIDYSRMVEIDSALVMGTIRTEAIHLAGDQSLRSASLTSIVEMYQARSPEGSIQPLRSPGSFYYDYSEEFNAKYSDEYGYASPIHSPPGETIDTLRAGDITTPRDVTPATDFKDMVTGNELRGTSDYVSDYGTTPSRERKEPNLDSGSNHENPRAGQSKENQLVTSTRVEPGSSVPSTDTSKDEWIWGENDDDQDAQGSADASPEMSAPFPKTFPAQVENGTIEPPMPKATKGRHRRNPATANIKMDNRNALASPRHIQGKESISPAILAPNPISPAHQLRMTNSIPQLMKALPPLPDEAQHNTEIPYGTSSIGDRAPTHLMFASSPAYTASLGKSGPTRSATVPRANPTPCGEELAKPSHDQIPSNSSRFKVRLRSSRSAGLHSKWSMESLGVPERGSSNPIKPRLKLKVSRNRLSSGFLGPEGTVVRNTGLQQHSSLLKLKNFPQRGALKTRSSFREALEEQLAQLGTDKRLSNIDEGTVRGPSRQLSDQFDIPYPPSTKGIVMAELVTQPKFESGTELFGRRRPSDRGAHLNPLSKKSSFFQPRKPRMINRRKFKSTSNTYGSDATPYRSSNTRDSSSDDSVLAPSHIDMMLSRRLRNKTRRVKRWATEAKRAVRTLMRRTLIRPQYSQSEG